MTSAPRTTKVLITGISGLLGNNLAYCLREKYSILGIFHQHACSIEGIALKRVDLNDLPQVKAVIDEFRPEVIIHCAALSDMEYCEANHDLAYQANVVATRFLIDAVAKNSCQFIYISTDAVYDEQDFLISEEASLNPSNYYAQTKIDAEKEVIKHSNTLILRTNIFGWNIQDKFSLGEWVIDELSRHNKIKGFKDVQFSSIYTFELAKIIDAAIQKKPQGVYNAASRTYLSKYQFICLIAKHFKFDIKLIEPISVNDFVFKAKRRKFMALNVDKIQQELGILCPTVEECVEKFYQDFKNKEPSIIKSGLVREFYPKLDFIPYGRQGVTQDDISAVVDVLKSNNLTQGPKVLEFENALAQQVKARHALAVNSGTSALH